MIFFFRLNICTAIMGKRRKGSNKKSDAKLSGLKNAVSDDEGDAVGEDGVFGDVERWERDEDQRILGNISIGRRRKDDEVSKEVFALSGTDSDSDLELPDVKKMRKQKYKKKETKQDEEIEDSDLGSVGDNEEEQDLRRWGSKKKYYYGGNTGQEMDDDLDDSDLEEDKMEEIEAAKLQSKQLAMMEEEDFLDTFVPKKVEEKKKDKKVVTVDSVTKDFSKLSAKEQSQLFRQQNPEFDGVVADFHESLAEAAKLSKVVSLAESGEIPAGPCLDFVRYKLEILLNYSTNISAYLMFKSKGINLTLHPVTGRLVQYRQLLDQLREVDSQVTEQVNTLLERLERGESVKSLVKEERRRVKRELLRKKAKPLKFKKIESERVKKKEKKKKKERIENADLEEELTLDERMALEVYQAMRKKKNDDAEESEEEEDEDIVDENISNAEEEEITPANTYNNENEDLEEDDIEVDEKRGITYKIAKNKGLTPKRSKLQRNPRVKNRVKYQKAMKRRKGAVREVRDQNTKYGGEASGINMRVKKGVKFN